MVCRTKIACAVLLAGLLSVSPALGEVTVGFDQTAYYVSQGEVFDVDIVATFTDDISAWGLDLNIDDAAIAWLDSFVVADPPFNPVVGSLDGVPLGGIVFGAVGPGTYTLATLTFEAGMMDGSTGIWLSYDDEDEGFLMTDNGLDSVVYEGATIYVPEPASLALLTLGGIALIRRR
jgi:hypothetical protein